MPEPLSPADQEALERIWSEVWEPARERGDTSTPFWEVMADFVSRALAAVPSLGHEAGEREEWREVVADCLADIRERCNPHLSHIERKLASLVEDPLAATPPGRSMPTGGEG